MASPCRSSERTEAAEEWSHFGRQKRAPIRGASSGRPRAHLLARPRLAAIVAQIQSSCGMALSRGADSASARVEMDEHLFGRPFVLRNTKQRAPKINLPQR